MTKLNWDYTLLAPTYDKRGDYADAAIDEMLSLLKPSPDRHIAEIGAGTGKLTKMLLGRGYMVRAVEPNSAMRKYGIKNTRGQKVEWSVGTGEDTGLEDSSFDLVAFGSSFNVTDRSLALKEVARISCPTGWFACMWNHRDLNDDLQHHCEIIINKYIPDYHYGSRREDQTQVIQDSGLFHEPVQITGKVVQKMSHADFVAAWKSHATLQRQSGADFQKIIREIELSLPGGDIIGVAYTTRIWCAQLI